MRGRIFSIVFAYCVGVSVAGAQDLLEIEVEIEEAQDAFVVQPQFTDENFDQWVFQQHSSAAGARKSMIDQLTVIAEDVQRTCELTTTQKNKLSLAGRGDINRFFDRYDEVKKQFHLKRHDQQKMNEIWQDISPLQMTTNSGLFQSDSFVCKSLRNILTQEQYERYHQAERERREFRHVAVIGLTVHTLEQSVPLRDDQRQQLTELLVTETTPSRVSGQYDYYYVMWQLSLIPEDRVKRLFDDVQWKVLAQALNQAKGMEAWLKRSGALPEEDEN
jgi:hypothetical protein